MILAISLAALAGFTDAVGFRTLGGLFVSFMSGNSTRLSVNISQGEWSLSGLIPLGIITLFTAGVMIGTIIRHKAPRKGEARVLVFIFLALLGAAVMGNFNHVTAVILMVLAMGASNNVFIQEGEVKIGVTYMTGTLVKLGQRLAGCLMGAQKPWFPYLLLWLGLVVGAILGSISYSFLNLQSLWGAVVFSAALCIVVWFKPSEEGV